ncbi:MAG: 16S rRNA (guanine(527)-N(7))-methyltransferase RsmG [Xanthomonadales bacterium]|nr:16S rRNA (guanine(527)-N(7))-methyltransferase RsmG [Xanthomonadales bacterium]
MTEDRNVSAETLAARLHAGLEALGLERLESRGAAALLSYIELLVHWNRRYNLTAVRNPAEMVTRHLLDSLVVLPWSDGELMLDAGTGAGLPGVPLAIARPQSRFLLLDSVGKKIRFLNHVKRELALDNVEPVQGRLESFRPVRRPDRIISRAFSDLASFASAARHLADRETRLLAMKGKYPASELEALPGWLRVESVEELSVPGLQEDRHLVIMSVSG